MNRRTFLTTSAVIAGGVLLTSGAAWADKAEARLEVPSTSAKGSEVTIKLTVIHSSNSFFHYTEWARVQVNGQEIARWDFSSLNLPEGATFSREIRTRVERTLYITASASCNLHGSANEANAMVEMIA